MEEFDAIEIKTALLPISFVLQPREFESRLPSFRCQVECEVKHPSGKFSYEASNIWFSTDGFDRFLLDLSAMTRGASAQARLSDLSDYVVFTLSERDGRTTVEFSVFRPFLERAEVRLTFSAVVDAGVPAAILTQLREYDRWWLNRAT